jgi:hypothetical protein
MHGAERADDGVVLDVTWPASVAELARMQPLPMCESWPMWV